MTRKDVVTLDSLKHLYHALGKVEDGLNRNVVVQDWIEDVMDRFYDIPISGTA